MLSNQNKYAIRAVIYLAIHAHENHKIGSKQIAKSIDVPAPFLAKILQNLSKAKIIKSVKGPYGGFYLSDKELVKNLMEVIECIDGKNVFNSCFLGLKKCSNENPCTVHHIVLPFRNALISELTEKSIAQIAKETKNGKTFIFLK